MQATEIGTFRLVILNADGSHAECETYDHPQFAIAAARESWMEDTSEAPMLVLDAEGTIVAKLVRGIDPEVCLTMYPDGTIESHRSRYILSDAGRYLRTDIITLA